MYQYTWDESTGGLILLPEQSKFSKEPRPVYYKELDILGFDKYWKYPKDEQAPLLWAEANNYIYKGRLVAKAKGGTLYHAPEISIVSDPEPDGMPLEFVNIPAMVEKNRDLLEALEQETVQKIYNTYIQYKSKIDVFYVAFSGGKDSIVTLDLVRRALPHDEFLVLFGNTCMEFDDTYDTVRKVHAWCERENIRFYESRSVYNPVDTWKEFGPPSTVTRWCCSVHKTAPQIILLRKLLDKPDFRGMAFVGVRADESIARSKYEYVTYGGKHKGQYSCNAILNWSSAEIFSYIFENNLIMNEAYKKGNRRAGCLICPRAAERSDYMNHHCYEKNSEQLVDVIRQSYEGAFTTREALDQFIENGGWKARKNGRDLSIKINYDESRLKSKDVEIRVRNPRQDWKTWIKTIGVLTNDTSPYVIDFRGDFLTFTVDQHEENGDVILQAKIDVQTSKSNPEFVKLFKNVFRKTACCVGCQVCQADCPYGCLSFAGGKVVISDHCHHCSQCHKVEKGCLVYKSLEEPKGGILVSGKQMSLNSYSHHAPKMEWMTEYFKYKNTFDDNHNLGSQMYSFFKRFLRDAKLLDETGFSETAQIIDGLGLNSDKSWGIIYTNIAYAPQVGWFVRNTNFDEEMKKDQLAMMMLEAGAKDTWTGDIFSSLCRMCELPMGKLGLGEVIKEKNKSIGIIRRPWDDPEALVILYALYRFAEACDDYYQFSLTTLMDTTIDRDGVTPLQLFGVNRETMVKILNGLSMNYPEFISASFTLDLDSITLRSDKTAEDVLKLF